MRCAPFVMCVCVKCVCKVCGYDTLTQRCRVIFKQLHHPFRTRFAPTKDRTSRQMLFRFRAAKFNPISAERATRFPRVRAWRTSIFYIWAHITIQATRLYRSEQFLHTFVKWRNNLCAHTHIWVILTITRTVEDAREYIARSRKTLD